MKNIFKIQLDSNRIFGLDLLRALAILFVIIDHGGELLPENLKKISYILRFDGVSIFFVLSGFLIGGILIKLLQNNKISWSLLVNFWKRRWFRTLPNYFLILIILIILNSAFNDNAYSLKTIYPYFIFSQNLFVPHPWFFPEAWSLSVEEWFYILLPFLIFSAILIFRISVQKSVLLSVIAIIIITLCFRYYRYSILQFDDAKFWDSNFRKEVFTRLDSIMFGILGAYLEFYHFKTWIKNKKQLLITGIILLLLSRVFFRIIPFNSLYSCVFSFTIISIGTLLLLPYLSKVKTAKGNFYRIISYISLISYSMYLLNYSIIKFWIIDKLPWYYLPLDTIVIALIKYCLFWFLVITMSILLYKKFEIPITNLRDKK